MPTKYLILLLSLICIPFVVQAQDTPSAYVPLNNEVKRYNSIITKLERKRDMDYSAYKGVGKRDWKNAITSRYERIKYALDDGHYIFDDRVNLFFDEILQNVIAANPDIPKREIRLFITKYPVPNAYCVGEGTILFNIGLLDRLENESQVAFVICHEIAHYLLDHVNKRVTRSINQKFDVEFKKEYGEVSRMKYGFGKRMNEILTEILYSNMSNSRKAEMEADELGLKLLLNTSYDAAEAIGLLEVLNTVDEEKYDYPTNLTTVFDHPEYPFQEKWLAKEDLLGFDGLTSADVLEKDSIKSHPDCIDRIAQIKDEVVLKSTSTERSPYFDTLLMICDYEIIEGHYYFENLDQSIYHSLKLLNKYPNDPYIIATISKSFLEIYEKIDAHSLEDAVGFAGSEDSELDEVLRFLRNMRLAEMKKVNYFFLKRHLDIGMESEDFIYAWAKSNQLLGNYAEYGEIKKLYVKKYGKGYYYDLLP